MLNRSDIKRMLSDLLRTELARHKADALAVFDGPSEDDLIARLPRDIAASVLEKASVLFGFTPMKFSSLERMADYAFASFLKTGGITFLTSGSTGEPKKCFHSADMIREEAFGVSGAFKGVRRIVSLVPANHLYGFTFTVALPHALNVPVLPLPALPTQPWESLLQPGDLVAGFPLFWNYWLRCENRFPQGVHAMSSTAPCKDEIIQGLFDAGAQAFTEIYGASETGAVARRGGPGRAFEIFPFWRLAFDGDRPRIQRVSGGDWRYLPDSVEMRAERSFVPIKRTDACVQVAGVNVFPKRVETVLAAHPAVKECRVRLMRPDEGNRLKAFVVLQEGFTPDHEGIIRTYLSKKLTVHELPRSFTFGDKLPVSQIGKDADW